MSGGRIWFCREIARYLIENSLTEEYCRKPGEKTEQNALKEGKQASYQIESRCQKEDNLG
jgi:hypothetical protein